MENPEEEGLVNLVSSLRDDLERCQNQYLILRNGCNEILAGNIREGQEHVHLKEILTKSGDDELCLSSMKSLYFCELPRGHEGDHRDTVLAWSNE